MHWLTEAPNSSGEPLEKSQYCKGDVNHVSSWQLVALPSVFLSRTLIGNTDCLHLILTGQLSLTPDLDSWRHQTRDWLPDRPVGAVCVQSLCNYTVTIVSVDFTYTMYIIGVHFFKIVLILLSIQTLPKYMYNVNVWKLRIFYYFTHSILASSIFSQSSF